jgi:hypothetical protein
MEGLSTEVSEMTNEFFLKPYELAGGGELRRSD